MQQITKLKKSDFILVGVVQKKKKVSLLIAFTGELFTESARIIHVLWKKTVTEKKFIWQLFLKTEFTENFLAS